MNDDPSAAAPPRRRALASMGSLALLLAVAALALVGWCAWRFRHAEMSNAARTTQLNMRIATIVRSEADDAAQRQALDRRMDAWESDARADRDAAQALDQRMRNLESALGALSDQQLRGHDVLLLDDAEFLLVTAQQRMALLHDAAGALRACTLAAQALAQVQDPAFAPARASTNSECAILGEAAPQQQHALAMLSDLRRQAPTLQPIEPHPPQSAAARDHAPWWKLWHAFSGILRIRRDDDSPLPVADANLARELLQLDLAQAQAALLAGDQQGYHDAAMRAWSLLGTRFDKHQSAVQKASVVLGQLSAATPVSTAQPGNALATLRGLRASHGLQSAAPTPGSSSGARPR